MSDEEKPPEEEKKNENKEELITTNTSDEEKKASKESNEDQKKTQKSEEKDVSTVKTPKEEKKKEDKEIAAKTPKEKESNQTKASDESEEQKSVEKQKSKEKKVLPMKSPKDQKKEEMKKQKKELKNRELEERKAKRSENLKAFAKMLGAKVITDEIQIEKSGYVIHRNESIGSGYFSNLFKANRKKEETPICVKLFLLDRIPGAYSNHLTTHSLKIMRFIGKHGEDGQKASKSVYFPKVFEIFQCPPKVYIFMEQFLTLSLYTRIKTKDTISEFDAKKWSKQLAEAIDCLQVLGIAHRNIRTEHIIFDKKFDIKLVGFGLSVVFWNEESQQAITLPKQKPFRPKDISKLDHLPLDALKQDYDPSTVDVWSWATVVCWCLHKQNPFDPKSDQTVEDQWNQYSTKFQFNPDCKQLLDKCFVSDPTKRITSYDILRHKWLSDKKKK